VTCLVSRKSGITKWIILITSGQSNLTTGHIAIAHGRFHGICQMAPVFTTTKTCFLLPTRVQSQTTSWSVQPFLHSSRQRVAILYNGPPVLPLKLPVSTDESGLPSNTWFLGPSHISTQTASQLVQLFLHNSWQSVPMFYNGPPFPLQNCPLPWGDLDSI